MSKKTETIGTSFQIAGPELTDKHPVDLLRLSVLKGAVKGLHGFAKSKAKWVKDIEGAIAAAAPNVDTIDVYYSDPLHPRRIPRKELENEAETIGFTIATKELKSLGHHHTIQDIMTWTEDDESKALGVKQAATNQNTPLTVGDADDAHLLAGATMALAENPSLFCCSESSSERCIRRELSEGQDLRRLATPELKRHSPQTRRQVDSRRSPAPLMPYELRHPNRHRTPSRARANSAPRSRPPPMRSSAPSASPSHCCRNCTPRACAACCCHVRSMAMRPSRGSICARSRRSAGTTARSAGTCSSPTARR